MQKKLTMPMAAGLIVVAIIAGFISYRFMPHREAPKPADNSSQTNWVKQKAMESQGDITKLSQEDQQELRRRLGGQADAGLRMMYQHPPN